MWILPVFVTLMLLASFASPLAFQTANIYSQQGGIEPTSTIDEIEGEIQKIGVIARQKGEVIVIWVKNLKSSYSADVYSFQLNLGANVKSIVTPPSWNVDYQVSKVSLLEFRAEDEPLNPSRTLRVKVITESPFFSRINWLAFGKDNQLGAGSLIPKPISLSSKTAKEFPAHEYFYQDQTLLNLSEGRSLTILDWDQIPLSTGYPSLSVRDGYEIKRAVFGSVGGDMQAFIVAKPTQKEVGFAIQNMNWTQGAFVFAPLDTADEALQYLQFISHETGMSFTDREYEEITSMVEYNETIEKMEDRARSLGKELEVLRDPPTRITDVEETDGAYKVERAFLKRSGAERVVYSNSLVYPDGTVEVNEEYPFVRGVTGYLL